MTDRRFAGYKRVSEAYDPEDLGHALARALLVPEDEPLDIEPAVQLASLLLDVEDRDAVNHAVHRFLNGIAAAASEHDDPEETGTLVGDAIVRALIELALYAKYYARQQEGEMDEYEFGGE